MDRLIGPIADLYESAYAEPPYGGGPLFSRERFLERTGRQRHNEGFEIVTAHDGDELAGFAFGFTFAPGRWWGGTTTPDPPTEAVDSATFAVIELVVGRAWRGRGIARGADGRAADRPARAAGHAVVRARRPGAPDLRPRGLGTRRRRATGSRRPPCTPSCCGSSPRMTDVAIHLNAPKLRRVHSTPGSIVAADSRRAVTSTTSPASTISSAPGAQTSSRRTGFSSPEDG
jgi:hypothetical protein